MESSQNLEVKIREGEFIDVHVDALSSDERERVVSLTIEVKGCWHRDLKTALSTQLAERYLKDRKSRYGIFLVLWFLYDLWEFETRKAQVPNWSVEQAKDTFGMLAQRVSQATQTTIRAFVLDATLPGR